MFESHNDFENLETIKELLSNVLERIATVLERAAGVQEGQIAGPAMWSAWRLCPSCGCRLLQSVAQKAEEPPHDRARCPSCGVERDDPPPESDDRAVWASHPLAAAPERRAQSRSAIHGQAKYIGKLDDEPDPSNPWLSLLRSAVEVAITTWDTEIVSTLNIPALDKFRRHTERSEWRQRLRDQAARLDTIGRLPDELLGPWRHTDQPMPDRELTACREALELENLCQPSTQGHYQTLLYTRRLVDEVDRLRAQLKQLIGRAVGPMRRPSRWISVEEQLPPEENRIYLTACTGYSVATRHRWRGESWYEKGGRGPIITVTHWQPLPGLPPDTATAPQSSPSEPPPEPAPTSDPPEQRKALSELLSALPRCEDCGRPATRIGSDGDERDALCLCDSCRPEQRLWKVETPQKETIDGMAEPVVRWASALRVLRAVPPALSRGLLSLLRKTVVAAQRKHELERLSSQGMHDGHKWGRACKELDGQLAVLAEVHPDWEQRLLEAEEHGRRGGQ